MTTLAESPAPESTEAGWYPDPIRGTKERFWDGSAWSDRTRKPEGPMAAPAAAVPVALEPVSDEERKQVLAQRLQQFNRNGWKVESQTDYSASLVRGHRPNHLLHLILSVLTLGLWLIVWLIVGLTNKEMHRTLSVDQYGQVSG